MGFWGEIRDRLPFLLTAVPACGAVWVWLISARTMATARRAAAINATITLVTAMAMATDYVWQSADSPGFVIPWFQTGPVEIACSFGVDGISLWPLVVLAWAGWAVVLAADRCCAHWTPEAYAGVLAGQSLAMGLFAAQDAVLFLCFSEGWAWWSFFVIGRPGGSERRAAAQRYLLISSLGNWISGIAAIGLAVCAAGIAMELQGKPNVVAFQYATMVKALSRSINSHEIAWELWSGYQPTLLLFWLIGLCLRWPIFPLHGWWISAMSHARAPMAALFGATALLQAGYVLFRFIMPIFPAAGAGWTEWLILGAAGTVLYAGICAYSQHDLRKLASYLALGTLAATLVAGLGGNAWTSLMCWQMLLILACAVTAAWLLIGRMEMIHPTTNIASLSGAAWIMPRQFSLLGISLGLMTAIPVLSLISGQAMTELLELGRLGWPNLAMMTGQLLGGWAAIRALVQIGFGAAMGERPAGDASSPRELTVGVLVALALFCGLAPSRWQAPIQSTWEKIHDPFAGITVPQGKSPSSLKRNTSSRDGLPVRTLKPIATEGAPWPPGASAATVWCLGGIMLWGASRFLSNFRRADGLAVGMLILGLAAELAWQRVAPGSRDAWRQASLWSLALLGLAAITLRPAGSQPILPATAGAWLLRIGSIGWAATASHLALWGLAWELTEFARDICRSPIEGPSRGASERVRRFISSGCLWLGLACCGVAAGAWDFPELSLRFASVETGSSAAMSAMGSRLGLVGMLLMISGIGCRCGLAPWSLGRGDADRTAPFAQSIVDQWLGEFAGLIMLLRVVLMMQGRYAQPIFLLLSIAGAGTALWLGISLVGEGKIRPLLRKISAIQFSGLVLFTALLTASHWPAVHPARVILGADVVLTGWAVWIVTFTLTITGLTALLLRLGIQDQQELYFENFVGLFSRRPWEGGLLAGWLLSVSCAIPVALFWPRWLSWIMAATMPLNTAEGSLSPNPVAFAAMACYFVAGLVQLAVIGRWTRSILLDPAISLPAGSPSRWQLVLAIAAGALCLAGGIQPGLLWNFWLGSGR